MSGPERRADSKPESSSERIPYKPTREAATAANTPEGALGQRQEPAGGEPPEHLGKHRAEVGGQASSAAHPPYVPAQDSDAEIQDELESPQDVPVLPANAAGRDRLTTDEQNEPIDDESMYDGRSERDKDRPPSRRS